METCRRAPSRILPAVHRQGPSTPAHAISLDRWQAAGVSPKSRDAKVPVPTGSRTPLSSRAAQPARSAVHNLIRRARGSRMRSSSGAALCALLACALLASAAAKAHKYKQGQEVPIWANKGERRARLGHLGPACRSSGGGGWAAPPATAAACLPAACLGPGPAACLAAWA